MESIPFSPGYSIPISRLNHFGNEIYNLNNIKLKPIPKNHYDQNSYQNHNE